MGGKAQGEWHRSDRDLCPIAELVLEPAGEVPIVPRRADCYQETHVTPPVRERAIGVPRIFPVDEAGPARRLMYPLGIVCQK